MAIIVEDGTTVSGANSYVSEAELTAYATARGVTLTLGTEQLLVRAMDYIESLEYKGIKLSSTQGLQWPRSDVYIDGYYNSNDNIPTELKNGEMEVAIAIDGGEDPLADIGRVKTKSTVGPISVEYAPGQSTTIVRKITAQLRKLLANGAGGSSFTVKRG